MNPDSTKKVWICAEDDRSYLIPADAVLPPGTTTLIAFDGEEIAVDSAAIAAYLTDEEDAQAYLLDQTETALGPIRELFSKTADALHESGESEAAQLFASILSDDSTEVFSPDDWKKLKEHIEPAELQAVLDEVAGEVGEVFEKLGQEKASRLDQVLPELLKLATKSTVKPQDWQKLNERIKASLDKTLKEGVLKDGFPEDYTQVSE